MNVSSNEVEFCCSVNEVDVREEIHDFEQCVAIYRVTWEGAINPDIEPQISIWEYENGDTYSCDDSEGGFEYHQVTITRLERKQRD